MKIKVLHHRSKKQLAELDVKEASLKEIKEAYQKLKGLSVHRQAFYTVTQEGNRGEALPVKGELQLQDGDSIMFKDLGPQIGWRTVFICEYFGPIFVFPLMYYLSPLIHGKQIELNQTQIIATALFIIHFLKREYETIFVHIFGSETMPIFNLFKNCSYYWGYAALIAYFVIHPNYQSPSMFQVYLGAAGVVVNMIGNYICHIILRNLRPPGSKDRKIPRGFAFEYVTCPNYTFEIFEWVFFTIMTQSLPSLLYTLSGAGQMLPWAIKKHITLKKTFDGKDNRELYPKNRKILIPFVY
ncbi:hypothetical protein ABK040_007500 [Willaertia magna]